MNDIENTIQEIIQIQEQYRAEVGSRRKPWPESIRSRVNRLRGMGLRFREISERTGIPYGSLMNWRHGKRKEFHALAVREAKVPTVTVDHAKPVGDGVATVTVATPDGYRLKVANVAMAVSLVTELRRIGGASVS